MIEVQLSPPFSDRRDAIGNGNNQYKRDNPTSEKDKAEFDAQDKLATAQTNPLAKPPFAIGNPNLSEGVTTRYIAAYGNEFKAQALPDDVHKGTPKECYKNASLLVVERSDLTYAEGYAYPGGSLGDMAFMHAWAVDRDGNVVDNTWEKPEQARYFGVQYDRDKYLKYLFTAKIYGVLGSTHENATKAVKTGGKKLR